MPRMEWVTRQWPNVKKSGVNFLQISRVMKDSSICIFSFNDSKLLLLHNEWTGDECSCYAALYVIFPGVQRSDFDN